MTPHRSDNGVRGASRRSSIRPARHNTPYVHTPLDSNRREIRLLRILPSTSFQNQNETTKDKDKSDQRGGDVTADKIEPPKAINQSVIVEREPISIEIKTLQVEGEAPKHVKGKSPILDTTSQPSIVKCELLKASLDDLDLNYEALSYQWENSNVPLPSATILLSGKHFRVRHNLGAALQSLRL